MEALSRSLLAIKSARGTEIFQNEFQLPNKFQFKLNLKAGSSEFRYLDPSDVNTEVNCLNIISGGRR